MNVTTKQLRAFALASQLGSFTKAAERLHVTQAGLSAMMQALESQLGGRLFDRTTRALTLTEIGRRMLPFALRVIAELDTAAAEALDVASREKRVLRVGTTPLVAARLMPAAFAALREEDPALTIEIVEIQRDPIQEQVLDGDLDMGLGVFVAPTAGLTRRKLFSSRLFCVSATRERKGASSRSARASMKWSSIRDAPLVTLQPHNPVQALIDRHLPDPGDGSPARYAVNHIETQIALAEIGVGVAIVPSFALPACRAYRVEHRPLRDPVVELDFYAITRSGSARSQLAERFIEVFVRVVAPMLER